MAWKIEKWLEEIFRDDRELFSQYEPLKPRELVIVAASIMDIALAELISLRLCDFPEVQEDFLGLNGDGRSPCASFGSRIQLGLLLGILLPEDTEILRTIKGLRNLYAHKVNIRLDKNEGLKYSFRILEAHRDITARMLPKRRDEIMRIDLKNIQNKMKESEDLACLFLRTILGMFQLYFKSIHKNILRIERINDVKMMGRD